MVKRRSTPEIVLTGMLAAIGISFVGLVVGLQRLVWGLWIIVSLIWILVWMNAVNHKNMDGLVELLVVATAFGPPFIIYVVLRVLSRVVDSMVSVRDDFSSHQSQRPIDSSPPPAAPKSEPAWQEILGLSPNASVDEIRTAYKSQIAQYHPDKVATLGEEIRNVAERRSKETNGAYERAMRAKEGAE